MNARSQGPEGKKWEFLHREILAASTNAAFMRGRVYRKDCGDEDRLRVRNSLKDHLTTLGAAYERGVLEQRHVANIVTLADDMSTSCGRFLGACRFRIGISQKALNLYLKYLWCHGRILMPPHCPFDGRIIGLLPPKVRRSYVATDDIEVYRGWVFAAKNIAQGQPLPEWELANFESMRPGGSLCE